MMNRNIQEENIVENDAPVSFFKKKSFITVIIVLAAILVVLGSITAIFVTTNNKKVNTISLENDQLSVQISELKAKILEENKKYSETILSKLFTNEQLASFAEGNWKYSISVNGNTITDQTSIYVTVPTVDIVLSETLLENNLPNSVNLKGSVTGGVEGINFYDTIKVSGTTTDYELLTAELDNGKAATFRFSKINLGDIITIQLSADMVQRLGLSDNIIEIFYASNN